VAGLTPLKDASKKEPTAPAAPPSEVDEIKADVKGLRDSLGRMGKSIGAIVTAVVAAVGYTQIHDIFPFPAGEPLWLRALAIGAAAAGLGASAFLVVRFFFAQRRILIESDLSRRWRWHVDWNEAVEQTHKSAWSEGAPTLYDLDRRSIRLDRIARRLETTTDDDSQRLGDASRKEADRLGSVVTRELWRAAEHILERRTRGAFRRTAGLARDPPRRLRSRLHVRDRRLVEREAQLARAADPRGCGVRRAREEGGRAFRRRAGEAREGVRTEGSGGAGCDGDRAERHDGHDRPDRHNGYDGLDHRRRLSNRCACRVRNYEHWLP
jgi:hypothetical protein